MNKDWKEAATERNDTAVADKDELARAIRDLGGQTGTHIETWVSVFLAFLLTLVGCVIFWRMQVALREICSELGESTLSRMQSLLEGAIVPFLALSGGCFLILVITVLAMRWTRLRLEREHRHGQLSDMVMRLVGQYQDEYLGQISSWLHDEVGHGLVLQKMDIEYLMLKGRVAAIDGTRLIQQMKDMIGKIRSMAGMIYPHALSQFGLSSALANLAENFSRVTHVDLDQNIGVIDEHCSKEVGMLIFRIVQEALTNVAKHSGATKVCVEVTYVDDRLEGCVCNNGIAFSPGSGNKRGGIGIMVLSERAKRVGGLITVGPGNGWSYRLGFSFPVQDTSQSIDVKR